MIDDIAAVNLRVDISSLDGTKKCLFGTGGGSLRNHTHEITQFRVTFSQSKLPSGRNVAQGQAFEKR